MNAARIAYIGHATVLIEIDGVRLLTDPVLRRRVGHLRRREQLRRPARRHDVDAVLISHLHWDHLDLPSLRMLGRETRLIVPAGTAAFLRRRGFDHVDEIDVGRRVSVGSVSIEATYANHAGHRPLFGPRVNSLGFLVHGRQTIYFAGDTDVFPEMASLVSDLDVALLPVWGWGPTLGPGHMDPRRAAEALALLDPRLAIPIHWGTLHPLGMGWLRPRFLYAPPWQFAHHARQLAPGVQVEVVPPGHAYHTFGTGETRAN